MDKTNVNNMCPFHHSEGCFHEQTYGQTHTYIHTDIPDTCPFHHSGRRQHRSWFHPQTDLSPEHTSLGLASPDELGTNTEKKIQIPNLQKVVPIDLIKNFPTFAGIWTPNLWLMRPELYHKTTLAGESERC